MMFKILLLLSSFYPTNSFTHDLCVVGATGGLGRELVYQAINVRKKNVLALTSNINNKIYLPYRGDSFNYKTTNETFAGNNLVIDSYWISKPLEFKHIIF